MLLREREAFIAVLTRGPYWKLSGRNTPKSHMLNVLIIILQNTPGHFNLDYDHAKSSFDPCFSQSLKANTEAFIVIL
jgi:hypothetical protein